MLICHASSVFYLSTFFSAAVSSKSLGIDRSISSESLLSHSLILPFAPFIRIEHDEVAKKKEINNRAKWERSKFNRVPDGYVRKGWTLKQEAGGEAAACAQRQARWRSNLQASIGLVCVGEGILEEGLQGYQISPIRVHEGRLYLAQGQHVSEMGANDSVGKNTRHALMTDSQPPENQH